MEIKFAGRVVKVRAAFDLKDAEVLTLADKSRFVPARLRITYADDGYQLWYLEGRKLRKDGTPAARDTTAYEHDFLYEIRAGYQVPEWITDLVREHAPKTMDI